MSKDALVYIIVFLISFIISGAMLLYVYMTNMPKHTIADTLAVEAKIDTEIIDSLEVYLEQPQRPSFLDHRSIQSDLQEHEQMYLDLVKQIRDVYSGPKTKVVTLEDIQTQMDSTLTVMTAQMDSLKSIINLVMRENSSLIKTIETKDMQLADLNRIITNLNSKIEEFKEEITILSDMETDEDDLDFKKLARIYNNMDPKKIAQLMQNMKPEKSVNILKNMNQRKVAQVMAALPPAVATQYSQLLLIN